MTQMSRPLEVHEADPDVSQVVPEAIATLALVSKPLGVSPSLVNKYPSFAQETFLLLFNFKSTEK